MKEYIERDRLKEHILDDLESCAEPDSSHRPIAYGTILGLKGALSYVNTLPTADVVEVRHGKWMPTNIPSYFGGMIYRCSLCGANDRVHSSIFGTYCWGCGAKMDGAK